MLLGPVQVTPPSSQGGQPGISVTLMCGACNALSQLGLADFRVSNDTITDKQALRCICPKCGANEHFNRRLTAADEDPNTPNNYPFRAQQAAMIRHLHALMNLPVLPPLPSEGRK